MDDWAFAKQHPALLRCHFALPQCGPTIPPRDSGWSRRCEQLGPSSHRPTVLSTGLANARNRRFSAAHLALMINNVEAIRALLQAGAESGVGEPANGAGHDPPARGARRERQ